MKRIKFKHIIFAIIGISAIVSASVSIPYGLSVQTENFNLKLKTFDKNAKNASILSSATEFSSAEFDKLVTNLKPKEKFAKRLNAFDALNLHFDAAYNFDLNQAVDLSQLSEKYPNFTFKIVLPSNKNDVQIKDNKLKNLGINVSNLSKSVNYTTKFDLDFSKQEKSFQFSPENLEASISLSKLDSLQGKTATEIAILFNKSFAKNFSETEKDATKAIYKTFSEFGGISFKLNSEPIFLLPSNFEIKPELQTEKIMFTEVNDEENKIILSMILFDKLTKKTEKFSLNFVDLPKTNQKYGNKFLEIFKKNYEFNSVISKHLAKNNSSVAKLFANTSSLDSLNLSQFSSWFTEKQGANNKFLEEIKTLIPDFEPKKVTFSVKKPKKDLKNENTVFVVLKVDGSFKNQDELPLGLNLGENNQYSYNFDFEFDATESVYSGYFRNAIENFDAKTAENLKNLNFEIKKDLPVTIFASTIDNTIKHLFNKPLDLKNISKTAAPLFDLLNFSANKKDNLVASEAKTTEVSATLFQDSVESEKNSVSLTGSNSKKSENAGNYLKSLFENLEKTNFPPHTSLFLSSFFKDKYTLKLEIKTEGITKEELEAKIDNVSKDNPAYKTLAESVKMHLFLDWKTNFEVKEEGEGEKKKEILTSITAVNNPTLKFKVNEDPSKKSSQKVFLDSKNQGIYLAEGGISLEKPETDSDSAKQLKLDKGKTLFYAFKPTKLSKNPLLKYFLLKTEQEDHKNLGLIILPHFLAKGTNVINADFQKEVTKKNGNSEGVATTVKFTQSTYNGGMKFFYNENKTEILTKKTPKNPLLQEQDFLNNPNATIILAVNVTENDDKKSVINFSFYSSEEDKGRKELFKWSETIPDDFVWDLSKSLTIGTTKSLRQGLIDKEENASREFLGITFKGLALFDKPENVNDYNAFFEKFRKEYID
ncbi:P110/LppT family adhesin N-terminal domain [Mesomycoplasma dispar]|uniref:Uncharacterized protein n=1 Tax=Mesomycoplasma dispar TaxID=86660 RepID=A0ABN5DQQ4_9BACT|nr:P110/LppT family adhesin N-terminal domain [Mesomycoplasma dispar]ATP59426.1 hypothetical protein CSW10_00370 [Mesomycoplasma dispar]